MVVRKVWLALLVATFVCVVPFRAQISPDVWTRIETDNFELIGDASEAAIRSTAEKLERFRETVSTLLPVAKGAAKTRVVVFKDAASFRPFKPKRTDGTPDDLVTGLFQPGEDLNYIAITPGSSDLGIIYHEYAHDVLNATYGRNETPPWLNEGLAEYFQTFRITDDRTATLGGAVPSHIRLLQQGELMPWKEFFELDNVTLQQRSDRSRTQFYAQAWALINYLIQFNGDSRPDTLKKLAAATEVPVLDAGVKRLIAGGLFASTSITSVGSAGSSTWRAVDLADAQTNAFLGDLLYHQKEYQSAEGYLNKAIAEEPKLAAANASLGLVRLRQRRFGEAKRLLENAIAADSGNFLVHFYYGFLLTRENMSESGTVSGISQDTATRIRESLRRSISLNPAFAESHKLLAFTSLVAGDGFADAADAIKRAMALRAGDKDLALLEVQIMLRQDRAEEARISAENIVRSTSDSRVKKEAGSLLAAARELIAARSKIAEQTVTIARAGFRKSVVLRRKDLTDEQVKKIEEERATNNVNILIERPKADELQAVGYMGKVTCGDDKIFYRFKTENGELRLTGRRFDDLRIKVLIEGTRSFAFKCDTNVSDDLVAIVYRPPAKPSPANDGELAAISFVPSFFKLKALEDVARADMIIIEGLPATPIEGNEKLAAAERANMEREMRETQLRDLEDHLRKPEAGEERLLATPDTLECTAGRMRVTARNATEVFVFSASITDKFEARSFNADTGIIEIGCRSQLPSIPAVFTYRKNQNERELIALEFVPKSYKLN